MMAGTTRNILAMAWLAVTGLVSVQSELVSPPAQAQAIETLDADTCLSGRQVDRGYTYDNTCNQPITLKYCARTPYQDCTAEAQFVATQIAAYGSTTFSVPDGTDSIRRSACTAREEHYWLKADAFFGVEGRYRCRPNAAATAEFQLKSEVWRARPVELSSPRTAKCTAVINHGAMGLDADGSRFIKELLRGGVSRIQWSGACDVDGLISGGGTLSFILFDSFETWVSEFIGTADRGLLVGAARYYAYGSDSEPEPIFFDNGCNNWNGARANTCDPAAGLVERQRYLAASAPAPLVPRSGETFRDCDACPQMVAIPAGSFVMGSPTTEVGRGDNEGPPRRVTVPAFAAGTYELTWAQWDRCVSAGGCAALTADGFGGGSRPVTNVSWDEAVAYTKWLSNETGQTYRLLSEAEWEYVARSGTTTPFSFGNTISTTQANYHGDFTYGSGVKGENRKATTYVGTFSPNAFGLYDMHGNVSEWVQDCYAENYAVVERADGGANELGSCDRRASRGGSWLGSPYYLRSASRGALQRWGRARSIGLRVARSL